jgi:hypothetical protein
MSTLQSASFILPQTYFGDVFVSDIPNKYKLPIITSFIGSITTCFFVLPVILDINTEWIFVAYLTCASLVSWILFCLLVSCMQSDRSLKWIAVSIIVNGIMLFLNLAAYYKEYKFSISGANDVSFITDEYLFLIAEISLLYSLLNSMTLICYEYDISNHFTRKCKYYVHLIISRIGNQSTRLVQSVYLHPAFSVVSGPEDLNLKLESAFPLGTNNCNISDIFIENSEDNMFLDGASVSHITVDSNIAIMSNSRANDGSSVSSKTKRDKADGNMGAINAFRYSFTCYPPVVLMMGCLLSLFWIGYVALNTYNNMSFSRLDSLSQEYSDNENELKQNWENVIQSLNLLMSDIDVKLDNTSQLVMLDSINSLMESMNVMNNTIADVCKDLDYQADWYDEFQSSLLLALIIGGTVSLPLIIINILFPLYTSVKIRQDMQKGLWKGNSTNVNKRNKRLFSISTLIGTQLGVSAIGYFCTSGIIGVISLVFIFDDTRYFIWSLRFYFIGLIVIFFFGQLLFCILLPLKFSKSYESKCILFLSYYNLVSGQLYGFCRFVIYVLHSILTWSRIDIPMVNESNQSVQLNVYDSGYHAFIDTIFQDVSFCINY